MGYDLVPNKGAHMNIVFTNSLQLENIVDQPKPASSFIPEWYKKISSYISGKKEPSADVKSANETVKKCMPVFDMITAGYIITSPCDVYVKPVDGKPYFSWVNYDAIDFHPVIQTEGHPATQNMNVDSPKWINPWGIKTPKGWSILIMQPAHRDLPFTIMPGIVDTDTYTNPINFPFVMNNYDFEGLIPAGTPIAQIIPIKRESWKMSIGGKKEFQEINNIRKKMTTVFFDRYKRFWWNKKEYK
jgi:hypothetical protein